MFSLAKLATSTRDIRGANGHVLDVSWEQNLS